MSEYPYDEDIPVSELRLDMKNPRLVNVQDSQLEAYEAMSNTQGDKLVALAKHIVKFGRNPANQFITIPDGEGRYVVLDGNRRLTVLRALERPELINEGLSGQAQRALKRLSEEYEGNEIADVSCVVFRDRKQAEPWIEIIHDGESSGAGTIRWSAQQRARHNARKGAKEYHLQVLDFVYERGDLSDQSKEKVESGKYPVSIPKRLFGTPYVREQLGIDFEDGTVTTNYPKTEVLKGLTKAIDDIGTGAIQTKDIHSQSDRIDYISGFSEENLPNPDTELDEIQSLEDAPDEPEEDDESPDDGGDARERPHSSSRDKIIPANFNLEISNDRVNDIYIELKRRLVVSEVRNAAAVLLRVFMELSADEFAEEKNLDCDENDSLKHKVNVVCTHLQNEGILDRNALQPIRRAVSTDDDLNSIRTLHSFVHNRRVSPGPDDLKATWDTLAIFFEHVWPSS